MASFDRLFLAFAAIVLTIFTVVTSLASEDQQVREQAVFSASR